jgi:hypothetical protein
MSEMESALLRDDEPALVGDELWFVTPPGWIELVAHEDDEEAAAWFDRLLAKTPDLVDEAGADLLRRTFAEVRRQMPRDLVNSAGVIVTTLEDDEVTLWQYTLTLMTPPQAGDVNLMAVVERFLESPEGREPLGEGDFVESFHTPDGRDGIAVHTTTSLDDGGRLAANIPGANPDRLGVVHAVVRLNRVRGASGDRLAVIVGTAPNVEQRLPMSIIAAQVLVSARLRDSDAEPPVGRIDVDATGRRRDESAPPERRTTP